jgi:tRNA/tmRNA/rRNA uracil-C5-methylase (TrmA/RlmC/RlmD family)
MADSFEDDVAGNCSITFSQEKLMKVADSISNWVPIELIKKQPCATVEETTKYRCRCAFQIVWIDSVMHYAIRRNHSPVKIDSFPVANQRIQSVMSGLLSNVHERGEDFSTIRQNLTSVSFSTAWKDSNDADCRLTLFYHTENQNSINWKIEASILRRALRITQITGRSYRNVLLAVDEQDALIRDNIWLFPLDNKWKVSLTNPSLLLEKGITSCVKKISYEKPEGAFCHPNANAMCCALEWLIQRIDYIHQRNVARYNRRSRLLELYCGFGAHTVALRQTNILEAIIAVELDDRLVDACRRNFKINRCTDGNLNETETLLKIISADAGIWANKFVNNLQKSVDFPSADFDVLLVDPPRQGLDENVCRMANSGSFRDLLYISCGRDALARDLNRLFCSFEVVDCKLIDLFPNTNAVESLVHLCRKERIITGTRATEVSQGIETCIFNNDT